MIGIAFLVTKQKATVCYLKCSVSKIILLYFRKPNASCVFDNPVAYNVESSLSDILPGQIYNTTQQCTQIYGTEFCQVNKLLYRSANTDIALMPLTFKQSVIIDLHKRWH